jgi:hypothetical protein
MQEKFTLKNYPGSMEPAKQPMGRVHMDLYSSSITSTDGCDYSVKFTDTNSGHKLCIEETGKIVISNQVKFDENLYSNWNSDMVSQHVYDIQITEMDMMSLDTGGEEWIKFTPETDLNGFEKIHSGGSSDFYTLRSISDPRVHMEVKREEFFKSLLNKRADELLTSAWIYGQGGQVGMG